MIIAPSLTSNDTMGQQPVVCPLLRWPANSRRRNGNLSNLVFIQMEILAGSGQSHCPPSPPPLRVRCQLSWRVPVSSRSQQHPPLPSRGRGKKTLPVRPKTTLKVCVSKGVDTFSQTPLTFSFLLARKKYWFIFRTWVPGRWTFTGTRTRKHFTSAMLWKCGLQMSSTFLLFLLSYELLFLS